MNEWGIPDWRDPAAYGNTDEWRANRWRWEFLRRREDLRIEFDHEAERTYQWRLWVSRANSKAFPDGVKKPCEPGFSVSTTKIGGTPESLPNPRIGHQPEDAIRWRGWDESSFTTHISLAAPDGFYRVDFDMSRPIDPQIEFVRREIQEAQSERYGKSLQRRRRHFGKFLIYLRVLDARADGCSWAEIGTALRLSCAKPENAGGAARDTHEQAQALCFNF